MKEINILTLLTPKAKLSWLCDTMTLRQALEVMKNHSYTCIPVIDSQGHYLTSVSEGDFLWRVLDNPDDSVIRDLEDNSLKEIIHGVKNEPIKIDENFSQLSKRIIDQNFVPVIDDRGVLMGIITRKSIIIQLEKMLNE